MIFFRCDHHVDNSRDDDVCFQNRLCPACRSSRTWIRRVLDSVRGAFCIGGARGKRWRRRHHESADDGDIYG